MALWALAWLILAAWGVSCLLRTVRDVSRRRPGALTLGVALLLSCVVLSQVPKVAAIHHETTQELTQVLEQLQNDPGRGYTGTALFGYPARQFLIQALPSLVLGRSVVALHLGCAVTFLIALAIFARGLLDRFGDTWDGDLLAATVLTFLPHIFYFNHFMLYFEQSIYPFLFGMIAIGIALSLDRESPRFLPWLLGLANLALIHCYTPGLAMFVLVELALLVVAYSGTPSWVGSRSTPLVIAIVSAMSFAASLGYRHDLTFKGDKSLPALWEDLVLTLHHATVIPLDYGRSFVSPFFLGAVLLTLGVALAFAVGWRGFAVAAWACSVFVAAVVSQGYSWYEIPMRIHRAIVAFPAVLAMMAFLMQAMLAGWAPRRRVLAITAAISLPIGLLFQSAFLARREPLLNNVFLEWLQPRLPADATSAGVGLYFELPEGDARFENLWDFSQYFEPRVRQTFSVRDQGACNTIQEQARNNPELVVIVARTAASPWYACQPGWPERMLATYIPGDGAPVTLYRLDHPTTVPSPTLDSP
jgi:hypothetical protein